MVQEIKLGLCINLDGWDGEGDGRSFKGRRFMYIYG